jgi:hypothetical protein
LEHLCKSSFWSAFNWPIDEGSSFKLEHSHKTSSWSAFNSAIDEGSFFQLGTPLQIKLLECI